MNINPPNRTLLPSISIAVIFTAFMAIVFGFGVYLFSVVAPDMKTDIQFSYLGVGTITASAQVAFLFGAIVSSVLAARHGAGRVIVGSTVLAGICLVTLSVVQHVWPMGILLTVLGACAASMVTPTVGVVSEVVPFEHRSKVNCLISSGTGYGQFINGLIVPFFILTYDWRALWFAVGTGALIAVVVGVAVLSAIVPRIFRRPEHAARGSLRSLSDNASEIVTNGRIVTRANILVWTLLFLNGLSCGPWQNYLAPFLRDELGLSVDLTGELWSIIGFLGLWSGFALGAVSDRIGIRTALVISYSLLAAAGLLVATHASDFVLYGAAVSFGLAFYAVFGLVPSYISKTANYRDATSIFGIANVVLGVGTMIGNFLGGATHQVSGTFLWVYVGVVVVALAGIVTALALPSEQRRSEAEPDDTEATETAVP